MPAISLAYPVIDLAATGANIRRLRQQQGLSVRDLQSFFGFEEPRAIYKWQSGQTLPSVDNLYALSVVFHVPMEKILVSTGGPPRTESHERQAAACRPYFCAFFHPHALRLPGNRRQSGPLRTILPGDRCPAGRETFILA